MSTNEDATYNGWTNYPTWNVALWISNEEGLYTQAREMTRHYVMQAPHDSNVPEIWTTEQAARFRLADAIKDWVRDELAPDLDASFASDLLGYALDQVAWAEIAENWIGDEE